MNFKIFTRLLILLILFLFQSELPARPPSGKTIVILGASHSKSCNFKNSNDLLFLNNSVSDFTTGQLFWTIFHGVIAHEATVCVLQTGGLDVLLGIPPEKVVNILENFKKELYRENISLIIVEDFPYWNDSSLKQEKARMDSSIRDYCAENEIPYLSIEDIGINTDEINPGNKPILTKSGQEKFSSSILNFLSNEY